MNSYLVFGVILLCGSVHVESRPQGLQVECKPREVSPGKWMFTCDTDGGSSGSSGSGSGSGHGNGGSSGSSSSGTGREPPTLNLEHVLWIQQDGGQSQTVDVEIPNYRINELVKAGFKGTPGGDTRVNVLVKKPELTYNAEVATPESHSGVPSVAVQYETVQDLLVHYPVDKPYRPLSGPILPPY